MECLIFSLSVADTPGSRIFSHKNGLQVPATNIQYPSVYNSRDYLPSDSYPPQQAAPQSWVPQQRPNWPQSPPIMPPEKPYGQPNWAQSDPKAELKTKEDLPSEAFSEDSSISDEDEEIIVTTEAPKVRYALNVNKNDKTY